MTNYNKSPDMSANGMAQSLSEKAQNMTKSLESAAHNFGSDVGKAAHSVSEKTSDFAKTSRGYIEENPIQSVAIAAAAGLVIGSLLTMISRKS